MNYIRDRKIELSKKAFEHINYKTKMELAKEELLATNPAQIVKWGWKEWDDYL
jgi:rare lipoprotein A (peptidoglycan hydrolase)